MKPEAPKPSVPALTASLKWVQANIAAFGGESARVTLVGESGGGRCWTRDR